MLDHGSRSKGRGRGNMKVSRGSFHPNWNNGNNFATISDYDLYQLIERGRQIEKRGWEAVAPYTHRMVRGTKKFYIVYRRIKAEEIGGG